MSLVRSVVFRRRVTALGMLSVLAIAACRSKPAPPGAATPAKERAVATPAPAPRDGGARSQSGSARELTWHFAESGLGPSDVVVSIPDTTARDARFPVLVTFHGRGESMKGPERGARGWVDDYRMPAALERLAHPPLAAGDFLGFVAQDRLALFNQALARTPYRGVIVVCPYLPDALHGDRVAEEGEALATFVVDAVLPRVYRETPALGTVEATGVDGVSLGGRAALVVGALRPKAFAALGTLQPAIDATEATLFANLIAHARAENPNLRVRLLTSDGDYFLDGTTALSKELGARHIPHSFDVVVGPHSYDFNRGPGVYEMLLFHDRALRGEAFP
jgi:enterochelin esterase-like enzyme